MATKLTTRFEKAAAAAKQLPKRPDNTTLLRLYALYKQATVGDVRGERPGMFSAVERAKYDAWAKLTGISPEKAMAAYVDLVEKLQAG